MNDTPRPAIMQRPKLHLRDLFWFVALVALALGWYQKHRALRRELHEVKYDLLQARQSVIQTDFMTGYSLQPRGMTIKQQQPRPPMTEAEIDAALQLIGDWDKATNPYIVNSQ
jgi:hypothetical protein